MPIACDYSLEELQEQLRECTVTCNSTTRKFDEAKENKEIKHQHLADVTQKHENITKKIDLKTEECNQITEKINKQQSDRQQVQQQMPKLSKKFAQLNEDIQKYQQKFNELSKHQPKVK
jgi:chromosome segregation ATPase